jgi:predicted amidohydrolase YtcJ
VTSHVPLEALGVPTHRSAPGSSQAWSPQEAVSLEDSLVHYTQDAAYSNFWNKGVIAVGVDADFVVLDKNPLKVAPEKVNKIKVLQVYVAGNVRLGIN